MCSGVNSGCLVLRSAVVSACFFALPHMLGGAGLFVSTEASWIASECTGAFVPTCTGSRAGDAPYFDAYTSIDVGTSDTQANYGLLRAQARAYAGVNVPSDPAVSYLVPAWLSQERWRVLQMQSPYLGPIAALWNSCF